MELITQTQVIDKHERPITCLKIESRKQFSNGLDSGTLQEGFVLFSASEDGMVHQWHSQGEKPPKFVKSFKGHSDGITSVKPFTPNKTLITTSRDRTCRIWDATSGKCLYILEGHTSEVLCCDVYDNVLFTGSKDRTVRVWTNITTSPYNRAELKGHKGGVNCLVIIPDKGYLVTGSEDCSVRVWSVVSGATIRILQGHTRPIRCLYKDSTSLFVGSGDGSISVWNIEALKCISTLRGHEGPVHCLDMVPIRERQETFYYLLSGSFDKTVLFWNMTTGKREHEFKGHQWTVSQIATYKDTIITGAADGLIRLWKLRDALEKEMPVTVYCTPFVPKSPSPVKTLFEKFLELMGDRYRMETEQQARENCWKVVIKLGYEDVVELENSETAHCPLCDKNPITYIPSSPALNTCYWVKILSHSHYYNPYQSWNLVACCKSCSNQPELHNIIDMLSLHPGRNVLLQQLALKLFIGFLPRDVWPNPTERILIDFINQFYHPKRSLYEAILILDSPTLTLLKNIYIKTQ